jgi:hypothetical protein
MDVPEFKIECASISDDEEKSPLSNADARVVSIGNIKGTKSIVLPSEKDKIRESVDFGSPFLALETRFFTEKSLLHWLATVDITEKRQIAYKAVCMKIHPNHQYLDDSYHFLTKKPKYLSIAIGCGLDMEILESSNSDSNIVLNPLIAHLFGALDSIVKYSEIIKFSKLILAGEGTQVYIRSKLTTCFRARNLPYIRNLSPHDHNVVLVDADWTDNFRYNEKLPKLILHRVAALQEHAPIYYAGVAYKAYHKIAVKLNKDKLLIQLTRDELITFDTFFPNVINKKILGYTDLAYKIALLGNDIAGYVLGFPIQNMIPNEIQIHEAIEVLTADGIDKYSERIKEYVTLTYTPMLPFAQKNSVLYSNDTDVFMENINNYVPFDIVSYQIGPHMYRFTRVEFNNIIEKKKNPWTNDWIPPTVLSTIKARVDSAKELGLPRVGTHKEILQRVEDGTLFESHDVPAKVHTSRLRDNTFLHFLNMAMNASNTIDDSMIGNWSPGLQHEEIGGDLAAEESHHDVAGDQIPLEYPIVSNLHPQPEFTTDISEDQIHLESENIQTMTTEFALYFNQNGIGFLRHDSYGQQGPY